MSRLRKISEYGQSIWLDFISKKILDDGTLERLVREDGITGLTSNPSIFEKSIAGTEDYDGVIRGYLLENKDCTLAELYEHLVTSDIRRAADVLGPVHTASKGADGFVSLEVSPKLAADTSGTVEEAKRLWRSVDRENLMIKVPATPEGIPAVTELIASGINVNVTLIFSIDCYCRVARAYIEGLRNLAPARSVASVASFFVSRLDSALDKILDSAGRTDLKGKAAIANSRLAYQEFRKIFEGEEFREAREKGFRVQRPLWASTSTKNPDYSDVLYVENLIGDHTVNTLPPATIDAFRDHGEARDSIEEGIDEARDLFEELESLGISLSNVTDELRTAGVKSFADSFVTLMSALEDKKNRMREELSLV